MIRRAGTVLAMVIVSTALLLALPPAARTHERKAAGGFRLTIGWGDEPAFSGFKNSVVVDVADAAGAPVKDLDGPLTGEDRRDRRDPPRPPGPRRRDRLRSAQGSEGRLRCCAAPSPSPRSSRRSAASSTATPGRTRASGSPIRSPARLSATPPPKCGCR